MSEELKKEKTTKETTEEKTSTKEAPKETKTKKSTIKLRNIFVFMAILVFALIITVAYRAESLKVQEIGENYITVFEQNFKNKFRVGLTAFIFVYVTVRISNKFTKKGLKSFFDEEKKEMPKLPSKSAAFIMALIASIVCSIFITEKFSVFANSAVFGRTDGVFGADIAYYMFTLPFIESIFIALMIFTIVLIAYTAFYYIIVFNMFFDGVDAETIKKSLFIKQLIVYLMILVILFAGYVIITSQNIFTGDMMSIQDEEETKLAGAGITDITVKLWGYRILAIVIIFAVIRLLKYVKKGSFNQCVISIAIVPVYLFCMFLIMLYSDYIYVGSNELDRQKSYIKNNIENTKDAYGININQNEIDSYDAITLEEAQKNEDLIDNIPLISSDVTLNMIEEQQENTGYYTYERTSLANYNNKLVYLTPREILNDFGMSYNNRTFKYTHGYNTLITTATDEDNDGYAEYLAESYNDKFDYKHINEPRIYFGLETDSIIATNTDFGKEYDYPITATKYEENVYNGKAGLELGFLDRLVLGFANRNLKLAFASDINENSKIITNRNIIERAKILLPGVKYDENPYLVISDDGRLVWVIDAYTTSNEYPYSQMTVLVSEKTGAKEKINYIRNSIKVLVDAYDGTTKFYITDRTDPIALTYENMYPGLFSKTEIPSDIAEHFVYPEFLYGVQAGMIAMYHDISEDTLYRGDDVWKITPSNMNAKSSTMEPYYTMLKTPDSKEEEFGLVVTFNKEKKQSITGYMVGTYKDGKPELRLYKFNGNNNIPGIISLNNQIDQDTTISAQLELLNTAGVKLVKNIIVVPIENTLLYVEPVYQVNLNEQEGAVPALKKVIVASGNTVAIGNTLDEALNNLFSDYAVDFEFVDTEDIEDLVDAIIRANNNLSDSLNSNNFEMIGKDLSRLENLINQLETARKKELEEEEKLLKETQGNPAQELFDKVENILEDNSENINTTNTLNTTNTTNTTNEILNTTVRNTISNAVLEENTVR